MRPFVLAAVLMVLAGGSALAASDDAWEAFRKEVESACLAAAEPLFEAPVARVDPFGSESYGLALVTGKARGADVDIAAICVFDKQSKAVEIGGELPAD
jgi:hypothetical protein